jgi:hypothetical protein
MSIVFRGNADVEVLTDKIVASRPVLVTCEGDCITISGGSSQIPDLLSIPAGSVVNSFAGQPAWSGNITFSYNGKMIVNTRGHETHQVAKKNGVIVDTAADQDKDKADPEKTEKFEWVLPVASITSVAHRGAGNLVINPAVLFKKFSIVLTGSGNISLRSAVDLEDVEIDLKGVGNVSLCNSKIQNAHISVAGVGNVKGFCVERQGDLTVRGIGDIKCHMAENATIKKRIAGMGKIVVK